MARWEPDARGRLEQAAYALFRERGYNETTVEDIAAKAGLTERTFFRHFADKREVLFAGSQDLEKLIVDAIAAAPPEMGPLDTSARAFEAAGRALQELRSREHVRARYALVAAHAELREREVMKLAALAGAASEALRTRGVLEPAASLSAESGVALFKIGFERWVSDSGKRDLVAHMRVVLRELKLLAAHPPATSHRRKRAAPQRRGK
jgi:AcrR family transcriptional regulator